MRSRLRVEGTVQGVGFRPFVHGLAVRLELAGFVLNDNRGVLIEVEGDPRSVETFAASLASEAPPLAEVTCVVREEIPLAGASGFYIAASVVGDIARTPVAPDVATCDECLNEMIDVRERRFGYAFTNCTNCGPRFTITTAVPYDRPNTTMSRFEMCADCRAEFTSPTDRRFHAQPIACPACGPSLSLVTASDGVDREEALSLAAHIVVNGGSIAVKGLGGFHLMCDATDESAVTELRRRKGREEKPFAIMVPDVEAAEQIAEVLPAERRLLESRARPIVLLRKRSPEQTAPSVSPGNRFIGIMLPYAPLHHLLLAAIGRPIVVTSANISEEPIEYRDEVAATLVGTVVNGLLTHDREIRMRCDDSVVRVVDGREYPIRRSRGYAPAPLPVATEFAVPVVGVGAQLKHTFCLGQERRAIMSHHIGDLQNYESMASFEDAFAHFTKLFDTTPAVAAHDLHPEYMSTKWALEGGFERTVAVQHHHAHIASCLVDNGRSERVIGLALDGTGLGDDGTLWGCELLLCDLATYSREAHLRYVPVPGGEAAIREPWRMAAVYLERVFGRAARDLDLDVVKRTGSEWDPVLKMTSLGINSPEASSAGRLFDAVAAIVVGRDRVSYEGQAAATLEQMADPSVTDLYACTAESGTIEGSDLVAAVVEDLIAGQPRQVVAARFHNGFARVLADACVAARAEHGISSVALSGGSFQNLLLLTRTRTYLESEGFEVLIHRHVPPNDGGISLGQAVVANASPA